MHQNAYDGAVTTQPNQTRRTETDHRAQSRYRSAQTMRLMGRPGGCSSGECRQTAAARGPVNVSAAQAGTSSSSAARRRGQRRHTPGAGTGDVAAKVGRAGQAGPNVDEITARRALAPAARRCSGSSACPGARRPASTSLLRMGASGTASSGRSSRRTGAPRPDPDVAQQIRAPRAPTSEPVSSTPTVSSGDGNCAA